MQVFKKAQIKVKAAVKEIQSATEKAGDSTRERQYLVTRKFSNQDHEQNPPNFGPFSKHRKSSSLQKSPYTIPSEPCTPCKDPIDKENILPFQQPQLPDFKFSQISLCEPPKAQVQATPQSPTVQVIASTCTGTEAVPTDFAQFYVLKPGVLPTGSSDRTVQDFAICHHCFSSNVAQVPSLASKFVRVARTDASRKESLSLLSYDTLLCNFSWPRVRQTFLTRCVPTNSIRALVEFATLLPVLTTCEGTWQPSGQEFYSSTSWPDSGLCVTCFETYIRHSAFEPHFNLQRDDADPNRLWVCDLGLYPYLQRVLRAELESSSPSFQGFLAAAKERQLIPDCPGEGNPIVAVGEEKAFAFRAPGEKAGVFCSACYYDRVHGTSLDGFFEKKFELQGDQEGILICDLASEYSQTAIVAAIHEKDADLWGRLVAKRGTVPNCVGVIGMDEEEIEAQKASFGDLANWYYLRGFPNIEICPQCYWTTTALVGAENFFTPLSRPLKNGIIRQCFLTAPADPSADVNDPTGFENTLAWRGQMLRSMLQYASSTDGDFSRFLSLAKVISKFPTPCGGQFRRYKEGSGRRWLGKTAKNKKDLNDCTLMICEECHLSIVKGTALEGQLSDDVTSSTFDYDNGYSCPVYTKLIRKRLGEACRSGNLDVFAAYWNKRAEVWKRYEPWPAAMAAQRKALGQETANTIAHTSIQTQQGAIQLTNQMNAQTNAFMMGVGLLVTEASTFGTSSPFGNSVVSNTIISRSVGSYSSNKLPNFMQQLFPEYQTSVGAQPAQAHHDAASLPGSDVITPEFAGLNDVEKTEAMLARFMELHAEWAALE
ncbi:hypothetical protein BP5796_03459 [Coleophoma crateriformis]|uniref:Uncharacterized protein n=1 Tax=Coleophoma crateriformis TaxID=565419 RepID=A0A3D8SN70_9HELO|nr:hypothetical protein BP5796_03459 [Coleophoma crateriformis]